jgi:hypothetical protein
MIKGIAIERYAVVIPALVILVAGLAAGVCGGRRAPVKSFSALPIAVHLFMTVKAQCILRGFVKTGVTGFTLLLLFSMRLDHWPGHENHGLDIDTLGLSLGREPEQAGQ